jgi:hypothetical protein
MGFHTSELSPLFSIDNVIIANMAAVWSELDHPVKLEGKPKKLRLATPPIWKKPTCGHTYRAAAESLSMFRAANERHASPLFIDRTFIFGEA